MRALIFFQFNFWFLRATCHLLFGFNITIKITWDKEEITTESTNYNPECLPLFEDLEISLKGRMNGNLDDHIDSKRTQKST